jgi:NAD(P)-dependent dehydrogenase (short-subunit alcohol dehydrogenase family)
MSARLAGKRAIVTGAASGIGAAIAERFALEGAAVVLADLHERGARATAERIAAAGGRASAVMADVATAEGAAAVYAAALEGLAGVDVLVNNAGIGAEGTLAETDAETWSRVMRVNVDSMFHCCRAVVPGMLAQGGGAVVNMASVAGLVGLPRRLAYGASKAAVIGFTKALAVDHARDGLRVNCICPGTVDTPWVQRFADVAPDPAAFRAAMEARQPVGRLGTAAEIAGAAVYLASDEAAFVTGAALTIDGGLTAA